MRTVSGAHCPQSAYQTDASTAPSSEGKLRGARPVVHEPRPPIPALRIYDSSSINF